MDNLLGLLLLLIIGILILRQGVWRARYRQIQNSLSSLEKKQREQFTLLQSLQRQISEGIKPPTETIEKLEAAAEKKRAPPKWLAISKDPAAPSGAVALEAARPPPTTRSPPVAPPVSERPAGIEEAAPEEVKEAIEIPEAAVEPPTARVPDSFTALVPKETAPPLVKAEEPQPESPIEEPAVAGPVATPPETSTPSTEAPELTAEEPPAAAPRPPPAWARPSPVAVRIRKALGRLVLGDSEKVPDWETLIGGRWLNLVGIVLLVVGLVLLSQQTLLYLGPAGKVGLGVATSIALLIFGIVLQRYPRYKLIAWSLIGGAWALFYFTAYAAHNIEAARIITDPRLALASLVVVAAGIIIHSFTYRSQLLTTLAYGLGFMAVSMSPVTLFSLVASGLLAASMIAVIRLLPWHYLALLGVVGTYFNHWRWQENMAGQLLDPTAQSAALSGATADQGFWLSAGILTFYWLTFAVVSLVRRPETKSDQFIHLELSIANTVGFLALSAWQVWDYQGGYLYYLTGPATVAYAMVAYLDRRAGQRLPFLFNASVAVALFAVTPELLVRDLGLGRDWLAPYWTTGAGLTLLAGYYARELLLRIESYLLCIPVLLAAWLVNLRNPLLEQEPAFWLAVPLIFVFFQALSEVLQRLAGRRDILPDATLLASAYGFAATLLLARFLWSLFDVYLIGLVWLVAGLLMLEWGISWSRAYLRQQGYALAAIAIVAMFVFDLTQDPTAAIGADVVGSAGSFLAGVLPRWSIVLIGSAGLYLLYGRMRLSSWTAQPSESNWVPLYSIAATALITVLAYREFDLTIVALAWLVWGLALFEVGKFVKESPLRLQGLVLAGLAFTGAVIVNVYEMPAEALIYSVPTWAVLAAVVAGLYFLFYELYIRKVAHLSIEVLTGEKVCHFATLLLALLIWKELPSVAVAPAWAFLALLLFELAAWRGLTGFAGQAHILMLATFGRLFMANFVALGEAAGLSHRLVTVVPVIATIYYMRLRILELLPTHADERPSWHKVTESTYAERLYSYAAVILIVVLARFEFGRAYAVAAWAPLALGLLILGQRTGNIDFRFQSYLIAILTFARSWSTNAYLIGDFYGIAERLVTTLPAAVVFFAAAFLCARPAGFDFGELRGGLKRILLWFDSHARLLYSALGSVLVSVLIFHQLSIDLVSIGWAIQAFALLILGFAVQDRAFRLYGLALLLVCLLKVTLVDLVGVETIYRILSFIVLGVILLLASLTYTRYRDELTRYL